MSWGGGTRIFDTFMDNLYLYINNESDAAMFVEEMLVQLEDMDWDNLCESEYYENRDPLVMQYIRHYHPSWMAELYEEELLEEDGYDARRR